MPSLGDAVRAEQPQAPASSSSSVVTSAALAGRHRLDRVEREARHVGPAGAADRPPPRRPPSAWHASSITTTRSRRVPSGAEVDRQAGEATPRRPPGCARPAAAAAARGVEVPGRADRCRRSAAARPGTARSWRTPRSVSGGHDASSPGPSPAANAAPCSAAVPLENATACARAEVVRDRVLEALDRRALGDQRRPQRLGDGLDVVVGDLLAAVREEASASRERP